MSFVALKHLFFRGEVATVSPSSSKYSILHSSMLRIVLTLFALASADQNL
jgi:hypothetical protein